MNVLKPIDQVVLPSKKVCKCILDQNRGYWSHMELIHFWSVFGFRMFKNQHDNTTCKNCLINDWKSIGLVVILPRSVYNFFRSKRALLKPHGTNSLLKRFSGFYRVIFYIGIFTGLHNTKFTDFLLFQQQQQKQWKLRETKQNLRILGSFHGKSACNNCLK